MVQAPAAFEVQCLATTNGGFRAILAHGFASSHAALPDHIGHVHEAASAAARRPLAPARLRLWPSGCLSAPPLNPSLLVL